MHTTNSSKVILLSSTGLYPYCKDAPARLFHTIGKELADNGLALDYVCISPHNKQNIDWEQVFTHRKITTWHQAKKGTFLGRRLQEIAACQHALKKSQRGSLFLFNSAPYSFFSLLVIVGKLMGRKTVYIAHGGIYTENATSMYNRILRLNVKLISFTLEAVVTVSYAFRDYLKRELPRVPIHCIHNSLDSKPPKKGLNLNDNKKSFVIFFMGRLEKVKGIDVLIYAFQQLHGTYKDCRLVIAGEGNYSTELQKLTNQLKLGDAISFVGFIDQKGKAKYFNNADLFITPSTYFETFGMVILEAMSFNVPVIASRVGGIPEVIKDGETGLLFTTGDHRDLLEKMELLYLDKGKRKALAKMANKRLKDYFNHTRMGTEYYRLIKALIS